MSALIGFVALFALLFTGLPLAFALGLVGFVGFGLLVSFGPAGAMAAQVTWDTLSSYSLSVLPLFHVTGMQYGMNGPIYTGATVAQKWWNSTAHRNSLYRPTYTGSTGGVCIYLAMTHGGVPNEPYSFTRAAARWGSC